MKSVKSLLNQKLVTRIAKVMKVFCNVVIILFILMLALSFLGRLQYILSVGGTTYENAIYAEENHDFTTTRALTVSSNDSLRVHAAADDGTIELLTYIAIVLMYAINIIPLMFAYWFLSKVFANVAKGEIFVEKNAHYLLYFGIIQGIVAVVVPFAKLLIVQIANILVADHISLATGSDMISKLVPSMAFLVAAYIIHYGVHLQDEVDHTL